MVQADVDTNNANAWRVWFAHPDVGSGKSCFAEKYERNNKKGGVKNLRCFPTCANPEGHLSGGHGKGHHSAKPLKINILLPEDSGDDVKLECYARFRCFNEPGQVKKGDTYNCEVTFVKGTTYCKSDTKLSDIRSKENQTGLFFKGEHAIPRYGSRGSSVPDTTSQALSQRKSMESVLSGETASSQPNVSTYIFKDKGWHYGWKGGRYKTGQLHVLEVFVFELLGNDKLRCIETLCSTPFHVVSSRRADPNDKVKRREKARMKKKEEERKPPFSDNGVANPVNDHAQVSLKRQKPDEEYANNQFMQEWADSINKPNQFDLVDPASLSPAKRVKTEQELDRENEMLEEVLENVDTDFPSMMKKQNSFDKIDVSAIDLQWLESEATQGAQRDVQDILSNNSIFSGEMTDEPMGAPGEEPELQIQEEPIDFQDIQMSVLLERQRSINSLRSIDSNPPYEVEIFAGVASGAKKPIDKVIGAGPLFVPNDYAAPNAKSAASSKAPALKEKKPINDVIVDAQADGDTVLPPTKKTHAKDPSKAKTIKNKVNENTDGKPLRELTGTFESNNEKKQNGKKVQKMRRKKKGIIRRILSKFKKLFL